MFFSANTPLQKLNCQSRKKLHETSLMLQIKIHDDIEQIKARSAEKIYRASIRTQKKAQESPESVALLGLATAYAMTLSNPTPQQNTLNNLNAPSKLSVEHPLKTSPQTPYLNMSLKLPKTLITKLSAEESEQFLPVSNPTNDTKSRSHNNPSKKRLTIRSLPHPKPKQHTGTMNPNAIKSHIKPFIETKKRKSPQIAPINLPQTTKVTQAEQPKTYTVKKGDTLSSIGQKVNISFKKIAQLNKLKAPYTLSIGQTLKLPTTIQGKQKVKKWPYQPLSKAEISYFKSHYKTSKNGRIILNSPKVIAKINHVAKALNIPASHLWATITFDSYANPMSQNKGSNATGLIQFMPTTAASHNTTVEDLLRPTVSAYSDKELELNKLWINRSDTAQALSHDPLRGLSEKDALVNITINQLSYVEKHFKPYKGRIKRFSDAYLAVFFPSALKKKDSDIIGSKKSKSKRTKAIYRQNPVLHNKSGQFTVKDIRREFEKNFTSLQKLTKASQLAYQKSQRSPRYSWQSPIQSIRNFLTFKSQKH